MKYVLTKDRSSLRQIESANKATIVGSFTSSSVEVQAKDAPALGDAVKQVSAYFKNLGSTIFIDYADIPQTLHKFIIGKSGSNIAKLKSSDSFAGRLIDVVFPSESESSDDVILVVKKTSTESEAKEFFETARKMLIESAKTFADFTTKTVNIDPKYHGRLIGSGGATMKQLLGEGNNTVSVKFPKGEDKENASEVQVRGPSKEVASVIDKINKTISEYKHHELMNSFTESVQVPKGVGRKFLQANSGINWLLKTLREDVLKSEREQAKFTEKELASLHQHIRLEMEESATFDLVNVIGLKQLVHLAKPLISQRAQVINETVNVQFNLLSEVSAKARALIDEGDADFKSKIMRRVVGKERRNLKKISEKHSVNMFPVSEKKEAQSPETEEEPQSATPAEARDGIVIKGLKSDVAAAKKEVIEFAENEILNGFSLKFSVPKSTISIVLGKGGSRINEIRGSSNLRIDFDDVEDSEETEVTIEGIKGEALKAKDEILSIVNEIVCFLSVFAFSPSFRPTQ